MRFAKLIELEEKEQVLLTVVFDDEDDDAPYKLNIETAFTNSTAKIELGFIQEDQALEAMDLYSLESAVKFRDSMSVYFS